MRTRQPREHAMHPILKLDVRSRMRSIRDHATRPAAGCRTTGARERLRPTVDTLVTDVDHTLVDWTRGWAAATRAMIRALDLTGVAKAAFVSALRESYERHRTLDASAALEDAARVLPHTSVRDLRRAVEVYRAEADRGFNLYPGVRRALAAIKQAGARVVAFTDAPPTVTRARLERLGLSNSIDVLVSTRTDPHPPGDKSLSLGMPDVRRAFRSPVIAPEWEKGSPASLAALISSHAGPSPRVVVVGDQPEKDIAPALACRWRAAWARYGMERDMADHALLAALCHWFVPGIKPPAVPAGAATLDRFDDVLSMYRWTKAKSA